MFRFTGWMSFLPLRALARHPLNDVAPPERSDTPS